MHLFYLALKRNEAVCGLSALGHIVFLLINSVFIFV